MEKIFHQTASLKDTSPQAGGDVEVQLSREHLLLQAQLAERVFNEERQAYIVYYPKHKKLLLAPMSDSAFKSLHDCGLIMLKNKNLRGDKSLSLQEILIDHDLDSSDRPLEFTLSPDDKMLCVML